MRLRSLVVAALLLGVTACGGDEPTAQSTPTPSVSPTASTPSPSPTPVATTPATASPSPTATARPTSTATAAPYRWSARRVTAADLPYSWRAGCPVGPAQLRLMTLPYVGWDGRTHSGELVVRASAVEEVAQVFRMLYRARFPIRSLRVVDEFEGSDDASMAADNTSGFNCRKAVGGTGWSQHSYGLAIDVNPRENPYVYDGKVLPPEGEPYVDRTPYRKGMAVPGGVLVRAFAAVGWSWGGYWRSSKDYQHFSASGQ
jgi:hypothetical protein